MSSSAISRDDVAHLASLARIDLSDDELDRLGAELPAILEHVKVVQQVAGDDVPPMSHPIPVANVFRADVPRPGLTPDEALAGAPASEEQRFLVPQILGEE
ncbi:Asp-tRNA(Asn)/Glu-tRNA(Gln) amidotransferase subunit GatC [Aeromicrobium phragmitis]|uniref:Aspartyl/glutamyl-tRNA(Asn/Gln) amidotransferase subunit C n=1 Tax=Aeromicrobium phragmitis TaxID=2478914 RepID=A0A3L8PNS9_9ACTN|nr:Asp-tRNA(Asn)/Glu-tRNA(Gln) amidotransferase subunit GatC [Aeromicrobium phragmitis]RLV57065.1 Asp-tRNA(Asn)/Glu-tRNA(Gln) amidotransferase subunit GatC [Aeromicrobium phragmitis]